jgi:hypothetical protein
MRSKNKRYGWTKWFLYFSTLVKQWVEAWRVWAMSMVQDIPSAMYNRQQIEPFYFITFIGFTYLSLAVRPKVNGHANQVVNGSVCALIEHHGGQRQQRQ